MALVAAAPPPVTVATAAGPVVGIAQSAGGVAWLESAPSGCRVRVVSPGHAATTLTSPRARCLGPGYDLALAGGNAAWGGYTEVRCSETTADVFAVGSRHGVVEEIRGDCL